MTVEEIRRDVAAVCMGFAELVGARQILQSGDTMLDAHVLVAEKLLKSNQTWVFARPIGDDGAAAAYIDAAYAVAGAVHLARTLPPPPPRPKLITSRRRAESQS